MADDNGLDSFLSVDNAQAPSTDSETQNAAPEINLEDEFAKLLNDFVNQGNTPSQPTPATPTPSIPSTPISANSTGGLDGFITSQENTVVTNDVGLDSFTSVTPSEANEGLDNLITNTSPAPVSGGLDGLITPSAEPSSAGGLDGLITNNAQTPPNPDGFGGLDSLITPAMDNSTEEKTSTGLKEEERELAQKIKNFQDSMTVISMKKNLKLPQTDYIPDMLIPNYKPSVGKKIAEYLLASWDIINKYAPEDMKKLAPDADDEAYLSFAESLNDTDLQLAIISYVEILIDIEICEVSYEQKKEIMIKNRIKRELYEEYMELQARKKLFIAKLKEKNFPIDVERLINNYFRAAQKDPDSSFEALVKNPAMFSPIQMEKIKPKFFGLIKVTPEDGVKANQKIGAFVKKLKV